MVFSDGFLFLVKELGLLTNPGIELGFWMSLAHICILYCKNCMR
jgi:hypothetical protein